MIRLRPTTLAIGRSDLKEYDERRRLRQVLKSSGHVVNKLETWERLGGLTAGFDLIDKVSTSADARLSIGGNRRLATDSNSPILAIQTVLFPYSCKKTDKCNTQSGKSGLGVADDTSVDTVPPGETSSLVLIGIGSRIKNTASDIQDPPPFSKDQIHKEAFFQHSGEQTVRLTQSSAPYAPHETPTLPSFHSSASTRPHLRRPLPRSPLFVAHNASGSPEHRQTSSLTPRVASRVAIHHTPGIIFSQPPRRPARRPQREFRHQTNSFSFDCSECSSAAYEQERVSSSSTTESARRTSVGLSLYEELQVIALQGRSNPSSTSSSPSRSAQIELSPPSRQHEAGTVTEHGEMAIFFSSQPALPSPFSDRSRSSSNVELLPPSKTNTRLEYSPVNSGHNTSSGPDTPPRGLLDYASSGRLDTEPNNQVSDRLPSTNYSPVNLFRLSGPVLSACKARTASIARSPSNNFLTSISTTSCQLHTGQCSHAVDPQTPIRNYHVYNDAVSPGLQPHTSADLPESRHQSRFHGSFTAPVSRVTVSSNSTGINNRREAARLVHQPSWMTPSRRPGSNNSPIGLSAPGFQGLYGGRENGDEEGDWVEGVRFNNTTARMLDLGSARDTERDLRQTPEPDDWRAEGR